MLYKNHTLINSTIHCSHSSLQRPSCRTRVCHILVLTWFSSSASSGLLFKTFRISKPGNGYRVIIKRKEYNSKLKERNILMCNYNSIAQFVIYKYYFFWSWLVCEVHDIIKNGDKNNTMYFKYYSMWLPQIHLLIILESNIKSHNKVATNTIIYTLYCCVFMMTCTLYTIYTR